MAPLLASNTLKIPYGNATNQSGSNLNRPIVHAAKKEKSGRHLMHAINYVRPRPDTTGKYLDSLTRKQALPTLSGSYDISIQEKDGTNINRVPTKSYELTEFLLENVHTHDILTSSIANHAKSFRNIRDTSALRKFRTRGVQDQVAYNLSHLSMMCPFADICDNQGREVPEKNLDSCCLPCSCESTCGEIGNCCDKRDVFGSMCQYPVVQRDNLDDYDDYELGSMYFIVDKCLDGSNRDCTAMEAASWGSLYPVYDPVLQMNFYNPTCAKCNRVKEFIEWGITLVNKGNDVKDEYIRRALRGETTGKCWIKFTPPRTMNIVKNVCSDKLVDRCNITGSWRDYDAKLEEACQRWQAPVLRRNGYIVYENIYCMFCNGIEEEPDELCAAIKLERFNAQKSLAFTIDYRQVSAILENDANDRLKSTEAEVCSKDMVKHVSEFECRRVLCPKGFVGSRGSCRPLLPKMLNDLFYVQLQLIPTSSDTLLPLSYLRDLTGGQQEEPGTWFDAQGAPLDLFEVYSKNIIVNNTEYAEALVVRVGERKYPINLSKVIKAIQAAIKKTWVITLKGNVFPFLVKFYKYEWYVPVQNGYPKEHVLNHLTLSGKSLSFEHSSSEDYLEIHVQYIGIGYPSTLKKMNFCNRVRLVRSEWIAGFQEIRLNTSKEVFDSKKLLGDSEFDIFLSEKGEPTVEICVEDFNPGYGEKEPDRNTATILFNSGILISAAMFVEYCRRHG